MHARLGSDEVVFAGTQTRDLPVAPVESLRQWWRRTHPDGITPAATVEAARRALKNQEEK